MATHAPAPDLPLARVRAAFSLTANARALVTPSPDRLAPLDGLRALSILWVILFHAGWHAFLVLPVREYAALLGARWMLPLWRGDFGVDVFFVLSGFLIGGMLIDEHARTGRIALGLFTLRRLLRLWPALLFAAAFHYGVLGGPVHMAWANVLYVSNFVSVLDIGMGWTWSLAIEEQFYLVCPWLVRALVPTTPRTRALVFAGLAAGFCAIGAWVAARHGYGAADVEIVFNRPPQRWGAAFDDLYSKPWMRAVPLLCGVASAYAYRRASFVRALGASGVAGWLGLVVAVAVAVLATHWQTFATSARAIQIAYVATYRAAFGAAIAYVLLLSLSSHAAGVLLARALSWRALLPIAQLAYAAYLVNPSIAMLVQAWLRDRALAAPGSPMLVLVPAELVATFAAALVLHLAIEKPIMRLRPR